MDQRHRSKRVVDTVASVGERVFYWKNEAGGELAERTAGVHERWRVGLEATLDHEAIEIAGNVGDLAVVGSVPTVCFSNGAGHSPEHVFRLFHRFAQSVLDQVSLSDHGTRVVIELGFALWGHGRYGHYYNSPQNKRAVKKKTMNSELHAWASDDFDAGTDTTRIRESAPVSSYLVS